MKGNIETLKNNFSPEIQALIHELLFESELIFYPKRAMVANLLGRFGVIESLPELYFTAADRYDNRYVRVAAMETIGALGAVEKIPFLRDSINNPNEDSLVPNSSDYCFRMDKASYGNSNPIEMFRIRKFGNLVSRNRCIGKL